MGRDGGRAGVEQDGLDPELSGRIEIARPIIDEHHFFGLDAEVGYGAAINVERGFAQAEIATEFGMAENAVKQAFHRFRQRYQFLLRDEIAHTVAMPSDIEDELRHLISVVRA